LLLCLVLFAPALETSSAGDVSPQAAIAEDNAVTVEARQEALSKLEAAVELFINAGETAEAARTLTRVGHLQLKLNAPQAAIDAHQKALALIKDKKLPKVEVDSLNGLAAAFLLIQKRDKVDDVLQRSLSLSEQSGYPAGQAESLLILSERQNYDNHVVALQTAQKALALYQGLNDKTGLARSYFLIGVSLMVQNILPEATQNFERALQLWRDLNDRSGQADALIRLSWVEDRKGEWQSAITYLTEAQSIVDERAEPKKMGQILTGLADAFNESGLPENGLVLYQRALEYYRQTSDPHLLYYANWGVGETYYLLRNYTEAQKHLQESLKYVSDDSLQAASSFQYLGRVYIATKEYSTALPYLQKALTALTRAANPLEAAQVRALIGQVYQEQGQLEVARQNYRQALTTFSALTDRLDQSAVYYALGRLELKAGKLDDAENYLHQSILVTENIRRVSASTDLTAAFTATTHERYENYVDCLMRKDQTHSNQGFVTRAFESSEFARVRSLTELLLATKTNIAPGIDPELARQEKSLRQSLRVKEDEKVRLLGTDYDKKTLDVLEGGLGRLESEYKQVTDSIRSRFPAYEQLSRPTAWSAKQIQEQAIGDDQTLLLEYMLGDEHSYVFAVTRTEISSFTLPARVQVEDAARSFYILLTANQPQPGDTIEQRQARVADANAHLDDATAAFSKLVLGPVMSKLGKKRLIIVPDGALQYIPFQALVVPGKVDGNDAAAKLQTSDQVPLILDHEIVNEPSASALALVLSETAQRKQAARSVAVLANPVFEADDQRVKRSGQQTAQPTPGNQIKEAFRDVGIGDGLRIPPLPASGVEANAIMALVPWGTGYKAEGFDASRATITRPELGQYRIIHFATHGLVDYEHPELSGLVLSLVDENGKPQDGFLRLHDIYNLKLSADLVVLSACNTGLGKEVKGEGLMGLTRGFMYAGAGGVAASLWKVDDEATAELMKRFYEGMFSRGLTPAAALREAQLSMWRLKRWHAPYYWAAFVIQGQYNQKENGPAASRRVEWIVAASVAGVALFMLIFFVARRRRKKIA
jgi:CHAT domain-containing protein